MWPSISHTQRTLGHFFTGLYSAYLVAKKVVITTKHDYDRQYIWESEADGSYTVTKDTCIEQLARGTRVTLFLKDDQLEYLDEPRLKDFFKKYPFVLCFPIFFSFEKRNCFWIDEYKKEEKEKKIKIKKLSHGTPLVNEQLAILFSRLDEFTKEEYVTFYRSFTFDCQEHLGVKHFSFGCELEFKAVLFIPWRNPDDILETWNKPENIKLYVPGNPILENCKELIPEYLNFMRGVVYSSQSRKLHQNEMFVIRENLIKKSIELFFEIAENKKDYKLFYEAFSKKLKLGIQQDTQNRSKIVKLLRFQSSKSADEMTSLEDYIARMKAGQKVIYYLTRESKKAAKDFPFLNHLMKMRRERKKAPEDSPFFKKLKKAGYEVLFMDDGIDVYILDQVKEVDGKNLVSATKKGLKMDKKEEELAPKFEALCLIIREVLGDKVDEVVISTQIFNCPCCVVTEDYMSCKRTMLLNPMHPFIKKLRRWSDAGKPVGDLVCVLFASGLLESGFSLDKPKTVGKSLRRLIVPQLMLTN